jgi:hypothetical protein
MVDGCAKLGRSAESALYYKAQMEAAGFLNVTETKYKWPSNRWPKDKKFKELGTLNLECSELLFSGSRNDQVTNNVTKAYGCFKI